MGILKRMFGKKDEYFEAVILMLSEFRALDPQTFERFLPFPDPSMRASLENDGMWVRGDGYSFHIIFIPAPYTVAQTATAGRKFGDVRLQDAIDTHKAFISIFVDDTTPKEMRGHTSEVITKILANLIDASTLCLWDTASGAFALPTEESIEFLREGKRTEFFKATDWDTLADFEPEELEPEIHEARRRYPEFVAAFQGARGQNPFLVKMMFAEPGNEAVEHMWIEVSSASDTSVTGELVSDPFDLRRFRKGDIVT